MRDGLVSGALPAWLAALTLLSGCSSPPRGLPPGRLVDLTHDFSEETVYWPTSGRFELTKLSEGMTPQGYFYAANSFATAEHGGTHIDAPLHFAAGHHSVDQVPLERLVGQGVVVDVSGAVAGDHDYEVRSEDLLAWESAHGRIPDGAIVLLRTGWGERWPDPLAYLGTDKTGAEGVAALHFPGLSPEGARWLLDRRQIKAVGIDTASIDRGSSHLYETHQVLFLQDVPAFENVAGLEQLPPHGALVFALPMKIRGGSGGPLRIVALVPDEE